MQTLIMQGLWMVNITLAFYIPEMKSIEIEVAGRGLEVEVVWRLQDQGIY